MDNKIDEDLADNCQFWIGQILFVNKDYQNAINEFSQVLDYDNSNELILFANGSIINSPIYRKSLNDSLSFHYSNINWISSKISAAYGSAMIASLSKDKVVIKVQDIIKGDYLVSC